jgi:hypothetical protein
MEAIKKEGSTMDGYVSGSCPKCASEELDYGPFELDGENGYFPFVCQGCGASGKEWFSLGYIVTKTED